MQTVGTSCAASCTGHSLVSQDVRACNVIPTSWCTGSVGSCLSTGVVASLTEVPTPMPRAGLKKGSGDARAQPVQHSGRLGPV